MPNLTDWAWVCVVLMQAMLGNVSDNVRLVAIKFDNSAWNVTFYLEHDDGSDREDISDTISNFGGYLSDARENLSRVAYADIKYAVIVTSAPISVVSDSVTRIIFARRESLQDTAENGNTRR